MIVLWLVQPNGCGIANPGSISDVPQQRSTRLHTGPNKNTNADRGQAPTSSRAQRLGQVALRSFAWGKHPASDGMHRIPRRRLPRLWSATLFRARKWGLVSSCTWGSAVRLWHYPSFTSFSYWSSQSTILSMLDTQQGSHFCTTTPLTCYPPLEIFLAYLWDQRK